MVNTVSILRTTEFNEWLGALRDRKAVVKITARIDRLAHGNAGDVRPVGAGVSEMRVDYGPGYRVYFKRRGQSLVMLLCGGDKSTQGRDIVLAKALAAAL